MARGTSPIATVGDALTRISPKLAPRIASISLRAWRSSDSIILARATSARPASVGDPPCELRRNSSTPSDCSSCWMLLVTDDCERLRWRAACRTVPTSATVARLRNWLSFMVPFRARLITNDYQCLPNLHNPAIGRRAILVALENRDRFNDARPMTAGLQANDAVSERTTILKSVCRSCHGGCGVLLHVRDGRLVKVEGDRESPLNHGRLCPIGTVTLDLVYHPDRLKHPLRRIGPRGSGRGERISGDQALDEIAERVLAIRDRYGPEAIALGTGTGRHHIRWVSRFGHALGTPNWCEPGFAQCFHPRVNTSILTFGDFPVCDFTGDTPPACILYWGHNPVVSGPDGETRFNVRDALDANPRLIVVDPRETELAKRAEVWLRVRPGADDALALAMLNVLIGERLYDAQFVARWTHGFEALAAHVGRYTPEWAEPITWVSAPKIRAAARLFAATKPSMLEWGCAIEHTPKCIQTIRALSMLPVLTGNVDVPGGWVFGARAAGRFPSLIENLTPEAAAKRLGGDRFKILGGEGADLPAAHIPTLLQAMREGKPYPVKAFLVFGNNTLTTYANTSDVYDALMKLDFMVCADLFMTPTAELADIVLPAASWPELDQVAGLPTVAANVVLAQQKAVRIGECKSDEEIFVALARRMKLADCTESVEEVLDSQLAA